MAPQPSKHDRCTRRLAFFLPTLLLSTSSPIAALAAVVPTSYSSHCASPSPAPDRRHAADVSNNDAEAELLSSFHLQPSTGIFSGRGADSLFSPNTNSYGVHGRRSLVFLPRSVSRTADPTLFHLTVTLMLFGYRVQSHEFDDRPESYRRNNHSSSSSTISFDLDGYYSSTSSELCMDGTGTEAADDVLMTVHFTSFGEPRGFGHGNGRISSLRDSTDDLYFETRDIIFFGMGMGIGNRQQQVSASIWRRMDPERIVMVASTTLSCVFTALWRLRASRRKAEEPPAMSMAMLVTIISLGCVALEFILSHWVFFLVTFVHMFS